MRLLLCITIFLSSFSSALAEIKTCFTPGADCTKVIVKEIQKSRKSIFIQAYHLTDDEIAKALVEAKLKGLEIAVIIDGRGAVQKGNDIEQLRDVGINVRIDRKHQIAHDKVIIMDAPIKEDARWIESDGTPHGREDKHWEYTRVITGSFNFTDSAQHRNAENLVVISNEPKVCQAFKKNWDRHWAHTDFAVGPDPIKKKATSKTDQKKKKKAPPTKSRTQEKPAGHGVLEFKPKKL
jgi:phosphatidylserine/phosphatidylglycerophosphate/cardiolipin synthase-like enzyme